VTPYQQLVADCNPGPPTHWLKRRADSGGTLLLESRHEDNPSITSDYLAKLDALTGVLYLRLRLGRWAAAEGMVYEAWDHSRHVLSPEALLEQGITIPGGMPHPTRTRGVYAGVDWGFSNPGVILVGAVDGDGRVTILHETYRTGRLISWWTDLAVELARRYRIETFACDPSEPAYLAQFRAAGLDAVAGDNAIAPGIQRVQQRLVVADDGRPRLVVAADALAERDPALEDAKRPCGLLEEVDAYVWDIRPGAALKELPVKRDDHAMDACRYLCSLDAVSGDDADDAALVAALRGFRGL